MTTAEYRKIKERYISLAEKKEEKEKEGKGLTEREDAMYNYLDRVITYVDLRKTAIECGNKNPDDNFMVKDAKERMMKAMEKLEELAEIV